MLRRARRRVRDAGSEVLPWALAIGAVALLARIDLLSANSSVTGGDGPVYFRVAHALVDGDGLAGNDFRTPAYPLLIVPAIVVDRVLGRGEAEVLLAGQDLVGILLAVGMLLAGWRFFGRTVGIAAGLLGAVSPVLLTLERMTYPDLVFGCSLFVATAVLAEACWRGGDRRWLVASGVLFGVAAWIKPAGQALLVVPFLALLLSTRSVRGALAGGLVAAVAMLATMAPWLVHNALDGTKGMSQQQGLTTFYRAFDDDGYAVPTDVPHGELVRALQRRHPSRPHDRLWMRTLGALNGRGLTQDEAFSAMGRMAETAIRRNAGTYATRSADDVRQSVGDLASTAPGHWEGFAYFDFLHDQLEASRVSVVPVAVSWAIVQVGIGLGLAWLAASLYGLAALVLPFSGDARTRAGGSAFLVAWLVSAVTTALGHGALWRYSASIAPLAWMAGAAGAMLVWPWALAQVARARRRRARPLPTR